MKVKLVNPDIAAGLIDPVTKRRPFVDLETGRPILDVVDVQDTSHWRRQIRAGDIRLAEIEPIGGEPIAPLTTRGK